MRRLVFSLFLSLVVGQIALAQPGFLSGEKEIHKHEKTLERLAEGLDRWLSGRSALRDFQSLLQQSQQSLTPYSSVAGAEGKAATQAEQEIVAAIRRFTQSSAPDAEGQRKLFLTLGQAHEKRTLALLRWRAAQEKSLLPSARGRVKEQLQWEAGWLPIWTEEARLTGRLQKHLLSSTEKNDEKQLLQGLLQLKLKADKLPCPSSMKPLAHLSQERLTLLVRSAEQLVRLNQHQSQGAVTRVKRLSKKLSELTAEFQALRLQGLQ